MACHLVRPTVLLVASALLVSMTSASAADEPAEETDPTALFRGASAALTGDRPSEAIAKLEALADRGVVDAVVSYNRGLAYAARVRAGGEQR